MLNARKTNQDAFHKTAAQLLEPHSGGHTLFEELLGVGDEAKLFEEEVAFTLSDVDLLGGETDSDGVEARSHSEESTP